MNKPVNFLPLTGHNQTVRVEVGSGEIDVFERFGGQPISGAASQSGLIPQLDQLRRIRVSERPIIHRDHNLSFRRVGHWPPRRSRTR